MPGATHFLPSCVQTCPASAACGHAEDIGHRLKGAGSQGRALQSSVSLPGCIWVQVESVTL